MREGTLVGVVVGWSVLPLLVDGITGGIDPSAAVSTHKNNLTSYIQSYRSHRSTQVVRPVIVGRGGVESIGGWSSEAEGELGPITVVTAGRQATTVNVVC